MNRRKFLISSIAIAGAALYLRPGDIGAPHNDYFSGLQSTLKKIGTGRPVMLIDQQRLKLNCQKLISLLPAGRDYRIVAKSLPSIDLINVVMTETQTNKVMVFHQPFMNALAVSNPDCDMLLGKPMPVAAAAQFYTELDGQTAFNPDSQLQWLVDSLPRLEQYLQLAQTLNRKLKINIEIDVGLHRGGLQQPEQLDACLTLIQQHSQHLQFSGFMGYDAHVGKLPSFIESAEESLAKANAIYQGFIDHLNTNFADLADAELTFNGAGSPTLGLHDDSTPLSEISAGSCLVKALDFDLPALADFKPAAFIATPVLKQLDGLALPGPIPIGDIWAAWDQNRKKTFFIYGGKWMAKPVSPKGLNENTVYGSSSNQMMFNASASVNLSMDDFIFLRPTQSEFVLLQFGDLATINNSNSSIDWWPVLSQGAGA